ncbi:MAG: hypothetical protein AB1631_22860 [Acidobacteriota bacterium]
MKLLSILSWHKHYWGVPHTHAADNRLIQICYECAAEREVKIELRPSPSVVAMRPGEWESKVA